VGEPIQPAECAGDATPVGFGLGRSALHVGHHHQTVGEVPAVRSRDRHRHRHPFTVQLPQQVGLPREIRFAASTETTDREVPVDAHAPHLVDASSASERFDANEVVTPLLERLPSHRPIFPKGHEARDEITNPWPVPTPSKPSRARLHAGLPMVNAHRIAHEAEHWLLHEVPRLTASLAPGCSNAPRTT